MKKIRLGINILVVIVVFAISEFIYIVHNRPELLLKYYVNRSQVLLDQSELDNIIGYLIQIADVKVFMVAENYEGIMWPKRVIYPGLPEDKLLENEYQELVDLIDLDNIYNNERRLARLFYDLGLAAYQYDENELTEFFWDIAVRLAPEWSFFHKELANYYLVKGKKKVAWERLNFCLKFNYSKEPCIDFLKNNWEKNETVEVGYYKQNIEDYYLNIKR